MRKGLESRYATGIVGKKLQGTNRRERVGNIILGKASC
jgi:hypothetical protein